MDLPDRGATEPVVAVLGGGMGGLACAHELARMGVRVRIYEAAAAVGGKARSQYVAGTGVDGRRDLPGEHGFRFYPGFYRHVIATMREIRDPLSPAGDVAGNLVSAPEAGIAMAGLGVITAPRRPRDLADLARSIEGIRAVGGSIGDLARYLGAHLKYLTACDGRREGEIERQSWAAFIGAEQEGQYAEAFREVLLACTRTMVAMDAQRGSGRTVGQASSLLLIDSFGKGDVDRTMMGPTSECWLDPWKAHLARSRVDFMLGHAVTRLEVGRGVIDRVWVRGPNGQESPVHADAFVLAVPLEVAQRLMTPALTEADPALGRLAQIDLETATSWMVGAQYFLSEDVPLCNGHLFFPGSPWSLTSISQGQFWNRGARNMKGYGAGNLRGILSVDISNCFAPDDDGVRLVDETSREGILRRVLQQILDALDPMTRRRLARSVFAMHLDADVRVGPEGVVNAGRLLVHPPGSRQARPPAVLAIPNLFIAADFVRTSMDLASMESANEAGRLAARGVLRRLGMSEVGVRVFNYPALERFRSLQAIDHFLHSCGLPHLFDLGARAAGASRARLQSLWNG